MISRKSFENNPSTAESLQNLLKERVFLKTEIDIVYSDLVNWERYNLLSIGGDSEKGDWKKLNYIEYTWVKIIQELRQYGFNYDEILTYKTELFSQITVEQVIEASKIDSKKVEEELGVETLEKLNSISEAIHEENVNIGISMFENIMACAIINGGKWSFLFFKEPEKIQFFGEILAISRTTGLEPATFGVTGQYSNQTKLCPLMFLKFMFLRMEFCLLSF